MRFLLVTLLLLTALFAKEASVTQLFNVQSVKVKKASYTKTIASYGFVKADESLTYDLSARFGGYVESLYANETYKKVRKGEVLAQVYSPEVFKAKKDYLNTLNYPKANKSMIESARTRLELYKIPESEIDAVRDSRKVLTTTSLLSLTNGYIFKKNLQNNSSFNAKKTLFEIVNLDRVWVELKIHQEQLQAVQQAKTFKLMTPSSAKLFLGKQMQIYPKLDPNEESFTLRLTVENADHFLKPGMYISAQIDVDSDVGLTLPATAVIRKNGQYYVFVSGEFEGEYTPVAVEAEVLDSDTFIIKSGLNEGDAVVNNALFMIDSDAQINGLY